MINSRKIEDLHPIVKAKAEQFIKKCDAAGIDVLITSTYRDHESQSELYAQGRTKPGKIVTKAKAGQSWHNWRVAFDVVPLRNGKPVWGTSGVDGELWEKVGKIGESVGLEWAGRWKTFKEYAHFQYTGGLTLADFQNGKTLA
jgi:peptidoglycan L-alanyl-D-glutamate endopeptidase CwlK